MEEGWGNSTHPSSVGGIVAGNYRATMSLMIHGSSLALFARVEAVNLTLKSIVRAIENQSVETLVARNFQNDEDTRQRAFIRAGQGCQCTGAQ